MIKRVTFAALTVVGSVLGFGYVGVFTPAPEWIALAVPPLIGSFIGFVTSETV